jgi:hypothetical protein
MRRLTLALLCCSGLIVHATPAGGDPVDCLAPNLRPEYSWIQEVLCRHLPHSPTLASLHERLRSAPVIVYLHDAAMGEDGIEGRLRLISVARGWTYLRIDVRRQPYDTQSAALLAHEFQHALEVAEAGVSDRPSFLQLFERIGFRASRGPAHSFDTGAAILAGFATLRELTGKQPVLTLSTIEALRAAGVAIAR